MANLQRWPGPTSSRTNPCADTSRTSPPEAIAKEFGGTRFAEVDLPKSLRCLVGAEDPGDVISYSV